MNVTLYAPDLATADCAFGEGLHTQQAHSYTFSRKYANPPDQDLLKMFGYLPGSIERPQVISDQDERCGLECGAC